MSPEEIERRLAMLGDDVKSGRFEQDHKVVITKDGVKEI